jgi:hypothetical protein
MMSATPGEVKWLGPGDRRAHDEVFGAVLGLRPDEIRPAKRATSDLTGV